MTHTNPLAALEIKRARVALLRQAPFFGALALRLQPVEDSSLDAMMATDGTTLAYNPQRVLDAKFEDLTSALALHVVRCAAGHPWRRGARDEDTWNQAGEYAATPIMKACGMRLPTGALYDARYEDHSAEQVHSLLLRQKPPPGNGGGQLQQGSGKQGSQQGQGASRITDAPKGSSDDASGQAQGQPLPQNEHDWKIAGLQAEMGAKKAGNMPGAAEQLLEGARTSTTPWQILLRRFITEAAARDYTWTPPNRRFVAQGIYLPSLRSRRLGPIEVFVDASGSCWGALDKFASELNAIVEDTEPLRVNVTYWDTQLQGRETFEPGDEIKLTARGGGGTVFTDCFTSLEEREDYERPACIIFLTDLLAHFPTDEPEAPLLWAATGRERSAPFGEVISIDP